MQLRSYLSLAAIAEALVDTGGYLETVKIRLFKNNLAITPATLTADLVEADYTGYAASAALVWGAPWLDIDDDIVLTAAGVQFQPTGTATSNIIYGWWMEAGTSPATTPILAELFDTPVSMDSPLDALFVIANYRFQASQ